MRRSLISLAFFLTAAVALARPQHFIVQPQHVLSTADIADLAARGIEVQRVLPGPRYLVRAEDRGVIEADTRIREVEPFSAARKIASSVYRAAARGDAFTTVRLLFHDDVTFADAQNAIEAAGGSIERPLAVDFDYHDLREREYPLLAAPALAERLRHVAALFPPNQGYEFQILYRRKG